MRSVVNIGAMATQICGLLNLGQTEKQTKDVRLAKKHSRVRLAVTP
jgi:hypothetical protein